MCEKSLNSIFYIDFLFQFFYKNGLHCIIEWGRIQKKIMSDNEVVVKNLDVEKMFRSIFYEECPCFSD